MRRLRKVFLVDDDETSNFLNQMLIEDMDIIDSIEIAKNGKEALEKIKTFMSLEEIQWPELILLDINMPVMDGFEFLEEFSKYKEINQKKIRVVLLTSSNSHRDIEKAKNFDIAGYINKPLTEEKLQGILQSTFN